MKISTLTPASGPRIIVIPDNHIGVPRYGTYAVVSRPAEHTIAPAASQRMANRQPNIPETQLLGLPGPSQPRGKRRYDAALDCYVAPPRAPDPVMRRPRDMAPPRQGSGRAWWIVDRETGCNLRKICAQTAAQAQQVAAEFAVNNGFAAADCYAMEA